MSTTVTKTCHKSNAVLVITSRDYIVNMMYRLGGDNRVPPSYPVHLYLIQPSGDCFSIYFRTIGDCSQYTRSVSELKQLLRELNSKYMNHAINSTEYCHLVQHQWLSGVYSFILQWGADLVIHELCDAVNHAEDRLNLPITKWPHYK